MTPGARLAAAIEVLSAWSAGDQGVDRVLTGWGRANRFAGSGDRHAIADLVHDALRRWRSGAWVAGADPANPRAAVLGGLVLDGRGAEIAGLCIGPHAPAAPEGAEAAGFGRDLDAAPLAVRLDLPDWLMPQIGDPAPWAALRARAPLDLRVNRLRADPARARAALAVDGIEALPGPLSPDALRVVSGARRLAQSRAYLNGLVEVQDAASQAVALDCGARPGMTVLDYCAGGGGKTLALAAAMAGQGRLIAHDSSPERLAQLPDRAARAGAQVVRVAPGETAALAGRCDVVLVDAPCSGSGAWRRNADAKWRLTPAGLEALSALQTQVLAQAARAVRPGGRLVYATCSMLDCENAARAAAFLASHPEFCTESPPRQLTPADGGDGFFVARFTRTAD